MTLSPPRRTERWGTRFRGALSFVEGARRIAFADSSVAIEFGERDDLTMAVDLGVAAYEKLHVTQTDAVGGMPDNASAHCIVGVAHYRRAFATLDDEEREVELRIALDEISRVIAMKSTMPDFYKARASACYLAGDRIRANLDREKALRLDLERPGPCVAL